MPQSILSPGLRGRATLLLPRNVTSVLLAMLILSACGGCQQTDGDSESALAQPAASPSPLTVVVSGDTHGWIIPCGCTSNQSGGLLRRGSYVESLRQDAEVVVLDVGGAADGTAAYQRERFAAILRGEHLMGLTAHNVGQAELAFGVDELRQLSAETGVEFLSANLQVAGEPPFATHMIVGTGQRILVTGVLSPRYATKDCTITDPQNAILNLLDRVDATYDRLVVLAYLPPEELRALAGTLPEADAVVGGPTGQAISREVFGRTVMLSATNKGKFLASVRFAAGQSVPESNVVEMNTEFSDHPQQATNLQRFRDFLGQRNFTAAESGFAPTGFTPQKTAGTDACRDCHDETTTHWDDTAHAHAWQRLFDEGAHVDPYCQQCHTTSYGLPDGFLSMTAESRRVDVGCESCHGPSADHVANPTVRTPVDAAGSCRRCHDLENSPHFEYDSYWGQIQHD